ncbi:MAG: 3-keto-disaccharide hydrolase [Daejeonella sp.]
MKFLICFLLAGALMTSASISQTINKLTSKEKRNGWVLLFDGQSSNGWTSTSGKPVPPGWEVKDGKITALKGGKGGDIITVNEYSNFDLSLDYNIEPGCNSGVKYFFTKYEKGGNLGMEYQILDDKLAEDNKKENHLSGSFYDVLPTLASKKRVKEPGQWNTMRIVAKGKHVEHWLNGVKILEFTRGSKTYTDAVSLSKFKATMPAFGMIDKGHILLQEHGGAVSFKNIKIKSL